MTRSDNELPGIVIGAGLGTSCGKDSGPNRPSDPRTRAVIAIVPGQSGLVELQLECGHATRRRLTLCPPAKAICTECKP